MESPIDSYLRRLHAEISELRDGEPYLVGPEGRAVDPDDFGICLATVDGYVYSVGVTDKPFSVQSLSKPFTYGLVLAELGRDAVDAKVDVEPSGESFTEISLDPSTGRPPNAMVNAGALAVSALVPDTARRPAVDRITDLYSAFAGRPLASDPDVLAAEMARSDRNHALAYLLRSVGILETSPTAALTTYLQQCSVQATCRDLALMAATLANGGTHPRTGVDVLPADAVERVLSVMMTSGMYDNAGDWAVSVGMPAKSGVGGGTIAVLPGQVGVAVFSPPLDRHGTSVRGEEVCRRLSADTEMHFVRAARAGRSAVRSTVTVVNAPSAVRRSEEQLAALREHGHRAVVVEVGGDLLFAGTESVVREITGLPDDVAHVVLDLRQVDEVSRTALTLIGAAEEELARAGRTLSVVDPAGLLAPLFPSDRVRGFQRRGTAVAFCEDELLRRFARDADRPAVVPAEDAPALAPLDPADRAAVVARTTPRSFADGQVVRRAGARFGGVSFIVSGRIHSRVEGAGGKLVTLTTLGAGNTFGEFALGGPERQEITEVADGPVEVRVLDDAAIATLEEDDPGLAAALWRALAEDAYTVLDHYLREVAVRTRD